MSLAAEVAALAVSERRGPRCGVAVLLDVLPPEDSADLTRLLDDPLVAGSLLSKALSNRGHAIKPPTLQRHRRRLCGCG